MRPLQAVILACAVLWPASGCSVLNLLPGRTVHQKCGWKAEDYFTDPKVVALCKAIEANDLAEMERLVKAGADVNAQGKGKMTPLLWSLPDNRLLRFKWLLEHGADPNIVVESDFNARNYIGPGDSVTHMACKTDFPGFFDAVFDHGGDPNQPCVQPLGLGDRVYNDPPLKAVVRALGREPAEKLRQVKRLIKLGADMNALDPRATPVMNAVGWPGQFDLALVMLEAGADFRTYMEDERQRLIHIVVMQEDRLSEYAPEKRKQFRELVKWLEDHGESSEQARADLDRWRSWGIESGEFARKAAAEVAERKARAKAAEPVDSNKPSEPSDGAESR
jgi:uncharacterized protein